MDMSTESFNLGTVNQLFKIINMSNPSPDIAFEALQLSLPPAPEPLGVYKPCLIDGNYLYLSGHGTLQNDGSWIVGIVGLDMDKEAAKLSARQVGLAMLATIKNKLGSFNNIKG